MDDVSSTLRMLGGLALLLAACACAGSHKGAAASSEGAPLGSWRLVGFGTEAAPAQPVVTMERQPGGKITGSAGCNSYSAPWTIKNQKIEIGPVAVTRMMCPPAAMAVEQGYLAALARVTRARVDGDTLELLDDQGTSLLRFARAAGASAAPPG